MELLLWREKAIEQARQYDTYGGIALALTPLRCVLQEFGGHM